MEPHNNLKEKVEGCDRRGLSERVCMSFLRQNDTSMFLPFLNDSQMAPKSELIYNQQAEDHGR